MRPPVANDPPVIRARRNNRYRVCLEVPGICYRSAARPWSELAATSCTAHLLAAAAAAAAACNFSGVFKIIVIRSVGRNLNGKN